MTDVVWKKVIEAVGSKSIEFVASEVYLMEEWHDLFFEFVKQVLQHYFGFL